MFAKEFQAQHGSVETWRVSWSELARPTPPKEQFTPRPLRHREPGRNEGFAGSGCAHFPISRPANLFPTLRPADDAILLIFFSVDPGAAVNQFGA
jgi:hypothetical protein